MRLQPDKHTPNQKKMNALVPTLVFLLVCVFIFLSYLDIISPPGRRTPKIPVIAFRNVRPCLGYGQEKVESFSPDDAKYICANMETEESPVFLELYVFRTEDDRQVDVSGGTFSPGPIAFYVTPLPPGKYWARINWARISLVYTEFEVLPSETK
jgi:hypothetical protein